ncbi:MULTISPECIES: TRAP transporter substrate-binding protein [unclassified Burkholderia]|uniref:TRAP transporter substrate-binding protein n=1 Tax=unclassified Burkholderia TaxID=2613784 RepID=UPI000F56E61D|nr:MULTISPECIES: TRAP transporter substrate-binding protein [unclassified Burkholderia]RQR40062.1 C4-dicarboxylate ABC transporter substrate-binding protein [Burkholderia sp. Bp9131]RQR60964.1 C4-dicarboxylate ABC transporter substrate-binding protein [Burkholderia sp. Bp9015]RQR89569.1 C4-dicarboxylate ABC transporter substrate-binding protein [Burkholderia sp. Bp8994]RQS25832.1 C4-dicarboxylate ABC transporter substrate-binding protein [Burkholderia sp. Bp8995]RQS44297.1 C4-dicarboxylate ABC
MTTFTRRRFLQTAPAATLAVAGGLPAIGRAAQTVTLRCSSSMPADQNAAHYVWYERLAANLKASVGDAIRVDYFPNSQLGKESDVAQQVKIGAIDMMIAGSSIWATVAPELGMLDLGYLFDSYAHVAKVLDGQVGTSLNALLQKRAGCSVLTWGSHFGGRCVFTKQPVTALPGVKGTKLRVLPTPAFMDTFKVMGAVPTPIPFGELYMAVQTGVVDGLEHDPATVLASRFDEIVKSCWQSHHVFAAMTVVMGRRALERIPANLRPAFDRAVADATAQQRAIATQKAAQAEAALKQHGMTFHPMAEAERAALRQAMHDRLYVAFAKQYPATAPLFPAIAAARG